MTQENGLATRSASCHRFGVVQFLHGSALSARITLSSPTASDITLEKPTEKSKWNESLTISLLADRQSNGIFHSFVYSSLIPRQSIFSSHYCGRRPPTDIRNWWMLYDLILYTRFIQTASHPVNLYGINDKNYVLRFMQSFNGGCGTEPKADGGFARKAYGNILIVSISIFTTGKMFRILGRLLLCVFPGKLCFNHKWLWAVFWAKSARFTIIIFGAGDGSQIAWNKLA